MNKTCRICGKELNEEYVEESNYSDYLCLKCGRLKLIIKEAFRDVLNEDK